MSDQKDKSNEPKIQDKIIFFIIALGLVFVIFIFINASKDIDNNTNTSSGNYTNYRSLHDELTSGCSNNNEYEDEFMEYYCNNKPWYRVTRTHIIGKKNIDYTVDMKWGEKSIIAGDRKWSEGQYYCKIGLQGRWIPCSEQEFLNYLYKAIDYKNNIMDYLYKTGGIDENGRIMNYDNYDRNENNYNNYKRVLKLLDKVEKTNFEDLNESPF